MQVNHLQELGIRRFFQVQRFAFAAVGIDPTSEEHTIRHPVLTFTPVFAMGTLCLAILHYTAVHFSDISLVTDALSPFCQGLLSVWKMVMFVYKRKQMVALINKIFQWNSEATAEEHLIIAKENAKDVIFCSFYHIAVAVTGSTALIAPFIIAGIKYNKTGQFEPSPAVKASQYLDHTKPFNYFLIHTWDCLAVYNVIYASVSMDTLFSWFMRNIHAQFQILRLRLKQAAAENDGNTPISSIIKCIQYHRRIIDITKALKVLLEEIIFVKFTITCLQICCLMYQCNKGGDGADVAFHGLFLISVALQLILYCQGGQMIKDESEAVGLEIYMAFQWEQLKAKTMKMLLMPIIRSRRICTLSGIFFVVDFGLYLWVIKTAASYITMLWTLDVAND